MKIKDVAYKVKLKNKNKLLQVYEIDFAHGLVKVLKNNTQIYDFYNCKNIEELLPYTGFKDKKDVKIYEYDLINVNGDLYMVKYWNGEFLLVDVFPQPIEGYDDDEFDENIDFERRLKISLENQYESPHTVLHGLIPWVYDDKGIFEVVGNKFENPELLKK